MSQHDLSVARIARAIVTARKLVSQQFSPLPLAAFIVDYFELAPVDVIHSTGMARSLIMNQDTLPEMAAEALIEEGAYQLGGLHGNYASN